MAMNHLHASGGALGGTAMMTVEEMKKRKAELGYTSRMIAEKAGLPASTVAKIFSGETSRPRYVTMQALEAVLSEKAGSGRYSSQRYDEQRIADQWSYYVGEPLAEYKAEYGHDNAEDGSEPPHRKWPRQGSYTLEDYYSIPDDVRVELIDGVIYDMTAPFRIHQRLQVCLTVELELCIREHGKDCEVYAAPTDVRLDCDDRTMVQPDVIVLCHEDTNPKRIEGAPEFVAEILSESTRRKDCLLKLNKYMAAGVREYWIIDPKKQKVFVYIFDQDPLPEQYSFDDIIPVGISGGECSIDFGRIKEAVRSYL